MTDAGTSMTAVMGWGSAAADAWVEGFTKARGKVEPYCTTPSCTATNDKTHRPDAHVAAAYHREVGGSCGSDGEQWPCLTHRAYSGQDDVDLLTAVIPVPRSEIDTWSEEKRMAFAALDAQEEE